MRGKETQLRGLALMGHQGMVCMPGTHRKWVRLQDGVVTKFQSFLTQGLYQLLSQRSILRLGLPENGSPMPLAGAFLQAVEQAAADPCCVIEGWFQIRAGGLLGDRSLECALARLSGLVVGSEIGRMAPRIGDKGAMLLGQHGLGGLNLAAMRQAGLQPRLADAETATRLGLVAAAKAI